jgi:starch phosphorylase
VNRSDESAIWHRVKDIPDTELWAVRRALKAKLLSFVRERARSAWVLERIDARQVLAEGTLLDPEALTIGFARRFATYKRATLLFTSIQRLKPLLHDRWRPVQVIFAGKAHPADDPGRGFIHQVYNFCLDQGLAGHVAFLEDYDMHMAKYLVQGVDVWLNTPRAPMEASGTSGQKASLNGVPNLSVLDGWWQEGYDGSNGWAISAPPVSLDLHDQDARDADYLYTLLEQDIIPLFYARDRDGIPRGWLQVIKDAIRTIAPRFCARRMVKEYMEVMYAPAASWRSRI